MFPVNMAALDFSLVIYNILNHKKNIIFRKKWEGN